MARKPNYNFERRERERMKAEKKAKRAAEKKEAREKKSRQSQPSAQSDAPSLPFETAARLNPVVRLGPVPD
jgi:hypothetical protein